MKNVKKIYYCKYDGMIVFRMRDDSAVIKPLCECPEYKEKATHVNAFSWEFVSYGYMVI